MIEDVFEFRRRIWDYAPTIEEYISACLDGAQLRSVDEARELAIQHIRRDIAEGKLVSEGLRRFCEA